MDSTAYRDPALRGSPPPETQETSFLEPIERTFASLKKLATNYALLGVLDARRAAMQFAWLIGAGILITVLVVTAWLAGVVALAVWLFGQGLSWPAVLLIAAGLNLVGAGIVGLKVKNVFDQKPFSALLRQIKAEPPGNQVEP
ncbi:MAG TPA: hypothetical protein VHP37_03205 [Burkholderiales bacterium]|nr:hypothetical protein [Burkholderiales bacterium]